MDLYEKLLETAKMMERFEDILAKEEACVKLSDVKKKKKAERFNILVAVAEKKLNLNERFNILVAVAEKKLNLNEKTKLEERRAKLVAASKDTKMLTMKMDELDDDAAMIVRAVHDKMLKRLADELKAAEKELNGEEEAK